MALSLLSLRVEGMKVANPEVVTKSWPGYFADMTPILGTNQMVN
jgi:5-enolpyruvylshikimate-3-phosphate synthase